MSGVTFQDNSKETADAIFAGCNVGLTRMAAYTADAFRVRIGSEGGRAVATSRPVGKKGKRRFAAIGKGESIGKREGRRYFEASPPGSFPGNRTGTLKRSMTSTKATNLVAYAGSPLRYASWLETGWERRKPLTPKQIRYLHALRRQLENAGVVVTWQKGSKGGKIWARPWLKRTLKEERENMQAEFSKTASEYIARRLAK